MGTGRARALVERGLLRANTTSGTDTGSADTARASRCVNTLGPFSPRESSKSVASGQPVATPLLRPGSQSECERTENGGPARVNRATARNTGQNTRASRLEGHEACVKRTGPMFYRAEGVAPRAGFEPATQGLTRRSGGGSGSAFR